MDITQHLLYQSILARQHAMDEILEVFATELAGRGLWDVDSRMAEARTLAASRGGPGQARACYNALLIAAFMDAVPAQDVGEYINLARKERLARTMLRELNQGKADRQRILELLNEFCAIPIGKYQISPTVALGIRVELISQFISDHLSYIGVAKNHITMRDVANVLARAVGTGVSRGLLGGKAAGMLLANRILRPTLEVHAPELDDSLAEADSYFLKSSVASEYVDGNHLEECHSLK